MAVHHSAVGHAATPLRFDDQLGAARKEDLFVNQANIALFGCRKRAGQSWQC